MAKTAINQLIGGVIATALFFPLLALATTTAALSPTSVNVTTGQKFNVMISVNPQGITDYTEKLEIDYPADILEAMSFTFGSGWLALTQPGYDSIDNTNGVLIKTAGYPGGFSSSANFGTVSFYAKKTGSGTIKIGDSSLAFQASSQSAITGSGTSFAVTAPVVPVTPPIVTPLKKPVSVEATTTQPLVQAELATQTAAAIASGGGNAWVWILVGVVLIAIVGYGIYSLGQKKRGDN